MQFQQKDAFRTYLKRVHFRASKWINEIKIEFVKNRNFIKNVILCGFSMEF